jgi:hypothetical protein
MGEFCPLRIPLDRLEAAVSPTDKLRKDSTFDSAELVAGRQSLQKSPSSFSEMP